MAFWTDATRGQDPKRQNNFIVRMNGPNRVEQFYIKTAEKPSATTNTADINYLNHTFKIPGRTTWNPVSVTFYDSVDEQSSATQLVRLLEDMGYNPPSDPNDFGTVSKASSIVALGNVQIIQLDSRGNEVETWTLMNAFMTEVNFGTLDYSSDEVVEVTAQFTYDFAKFEGPDGIERLKP